MLPSISTCIHKYVQTIMNSVHNNILYLFRNIVSLSRSWPLVRHGPRPTSSSCPPHPSSQRWDGRRRRRVWPTACARDCVRPLSCWTTWALRQPLSSGAPSLDSFEGQSLPWHAWTWQPPKLSFVSQLMPLQWTFCMCGGQEGRVLYWLASYLRSQILC